MVHLYYIVSTAILVIDIFLLIRNRRNRFLLLLNFFILYFDFSVLHDFYYTLNDYWMAATIDMFFYTKENVMSIGLYLILLTTVIRFIVFFKVTSSDQLDNLKYMKNDLAFYTFVLFSIYVISQYDRTYIDQYAVKSTPLYEYLKIIFVLMFLLSNKDKYKRIMIFLLILLTVVQDLLFGGRVIFIQISLSIILFCFSSKIKFTYLICAIPFVYLSNLISNYRQNYTFQASFLYESFSFVNDTFSHAFLGSLTVLYSSFFTPIQTRIASLIPFLLETFLGGGYVRVLFYKTRLNDLTSLSEYALQYHWNVAGNYFPCFFYFWGNWYLTIVLSVLFWIAVRYVISKNNQLCILFSIFLVVIIPRWYFYNFNNLFRSFFIFFILYSVISFFTPPQKESD